MGHLEIGWNKNNGAKPGWSWSFRINSPGVNMRLETVEESPDVLGQYGTIPIAFEVRERLEIGDLARGIDPIQFRCVPVVPPYIKNYDAIAGHAPADWPGRWNLSNWWFAAAFLDGVRAGGVALVLDASQMDGESARPDEAIVWDLRVAPERRRCGIGRKLVEHAEDHARILGKNWMKVETQDINVPACRFYEKLGYRLRSINPSAYPELPGEVQVIWEKKLAH
jgi:GNAT superfamily N-acetyltransferase